MMGRIWINLFALLFGLMFGAVVTLASADSAPCDCAVRVERQPNGLPK